MNSQPAVKRMFVENWIEERVYASMRSTAAEHNTLVYALIMINMLYRTHRNICNLFFYYELNGVYEELDSFVFRFLFCSQRTGIRRWIEEFVDDCVCVIASVKMRMYLHGMVTTPTLNQNPWTRTFKKGSTRAFEMSNIQNYLFLTCAHATT